MQIDRDTVIQLAEKSVRPINDGVLDTLHADYDEGDGRDDFPNYYRFLYHLGYKLSGERLRGKAILVELGCHYGAASYHFLRGGNGLGGSGAIAYGIDVDSRVKQFIKQNENFFFCHGKSTTPSFFKSFKDKAIDVLLIDSDHTYKTTAEEFLLWEPKVKPGGLILFDDIDAPEYADGCGKFFKELAGEKISLPHLHPENWGFGVYFKPYPDSGLQK